MFAKISYTSVLPIFTLVILLTRCESSYAVDTISSSVSCYMCDTSTTAGDDAVIPKENQNQPDCASTDPSVLKKFYKQCVSMTGIATGCDVGFSLDPTKKIVTRVYRDCVAEENKKQRGIADGQCKVDSYPPGVEVICICGAGGCNAYDGYAELANKTMVATMHGLVVPVNTVDISKGVVPPGATTITSPAKGTNTGSGSNDNSNSNTGSNGADGTDPQGSEKSKAVDAHNNGLTVVTDSASRHGLEITFTTSCFLLFFTILSELFCC